MLSLSTFQTGMLILGGDIPLDPLLDTSTGTSSLPYRALGQIKLSIQNLLLHDTWRMLRPQEKDFTFFSAPHNRYSRLDYFFLTQHDLPFLTKTTIEPITLSDHHPISITLTLPDKFTFSQIWRLDPTILTNKTHTTELSKCLDNYFSENNTPDTSSVTQWEAHKCVIQGKLISMMARIKRERQTRLMDLFIKLKTRKTQH